MGLEMPLLGWGQRRRKIGSVFPTDRIRISRGVARSTRFWSYPKVLPISRLGEQVSILDSIFHNSGTVKACWELRLC